MSSLNFSIDKLGGIPMTAKHKHGIVESLAEQLEPGVARYVGRM